VGLLRDSDLRRLLRLIDECEQPIASVDLPRTITRVIYDLIPTVASGFDQVDAQRMVTFSIAEPSDIVTAARAAALERLLPQHPLLLHFLSHGDGTAIRFSDLLSMAELRRHPIYCELYREIGMSRFMAARVPGGSGRLITLSFGRSGRDFTDSERDLVDVARRQVGLILRAAEHRDWALTAVAALERADDTAYGVIILGAAGVVRFSNAAARTMLSAYFRRGCRDGGTLPEELNSWLSEQQSGDSVTGRYDRRPYTVQRRGAVLHVELLQPAQPSPALLLTETGPIPNSQPPDVTILSRREAEVLWLAAHGDKTIRIAHTLGISPRTVEKHLASAYHKLGARNRAQAALRAFGRRSFRDPRTLTE
jgi:DNA-binding CsgD family transcriptional regulator